MNGSRSTSFTAANPTPLAPPISLARARSGVSPASTLPPGNSHGRIGRGSFGVIEPYWESLFNFADDEEAKVRLAFIWASENIATNTPDVYDGRMPAFEKLLHDENEKVRMEAPEIFRVLGKRRPGLVRPYVEEQRKVSETDANRIVRIHCQGAIKATGSKSQFNLTCTAGSL